MIQTMARKKFVAIIAVAALLLTGNVLYAWTGPSGSPPNNNVAAPINVGTTDQIKNAAIGVNGLAVFGNSILQAASYLNWGSTSGSSGYGIRDSGGSLEFKNSGGSWQTIQAIVSGLIGGGAGSWVLSGNNLYNTNSGNIGIGTTNPVGHASGRKAIILSDTTNDALMEIWGTNSGKSIFQQVGGNTYVGNLASASGGDLYLTYGNGSTGIFVKGTTGNVGIGTASPGQRLSVVGTIESTSGGFKFPDGTTQASAAPHSGTWCGARYWDFDVEAASLTWRNNASISCNGVDIGAGSPGVATCPSGYTGYGYNTSPQMNPVVCIKN